MISHKTLPYVVSVFIAGTSVVMFFLVYYMFPNEIYYWDKLFDKCNRTTAKYRYVIRFIFGKSKETFVMSKTTITIRVMDSDKSLIVLKMSPKLLTSFVPNRPNVGLNSTRFLLYRKEPLNSISSVVLNHDGTGSINVTYIEIQDIQSTEANIAYIGVPINALSKSKAEMTQSYPSATKEYRNLESDLKPKHVLRTINYLVYFYLCLNVQLLLPLYLIVCPTGICNDYSDGWITCAYSALTSGTISGVLYVSLLCLDRYILKNLVVRGIGCCSLFRFCFHLLVVIMGVVIEILWTWIAAEGRKFPDENEDHFFGHELFWIFTVCISLGVFLGLFLPIFGSIGYLIGFFDEPPVSTSKLIEDKQTIDKSQMVVDDSDDQSNDYYNDILKGNTKVKSISQYTAISKEKQKGRPPVNSPTSTPVKRQASTESTGSNYYAQLMKAQGKVKSVSQYK